METVADRPPGEPWTGDYSQPPGTVFTPSATAIEPFAAGRLTALPPILAMAPDHWDGQWMNRQQILSRLAAAGARVLYSPGQWTIWDRRKPAWRRAPRLGTVRVADGVRVDESPKWLPRFPAQRPLDALSLTIACRRLRRLAWGGSRGPTLLYLFHPAFAPYARRLGPTRLVYHAYDLYERTPGWTEELDRAERWLLQQADLCVASSQLTAQRLEEKGGREVQFLPNGADVKSFRQALGGPIPADLDAIPRPRIGYTGRLSRKVDFSLLASLAARNPQWHFVLLGPSGSLDAETREASARCEALPNIHFLGPRHRHEVPSYVAGLDVGLILYRTGVGLWSEACYPLKFHEYLAADRPVVSANLHALQPFAGVVRFAGSSVEEWENGIAAALGGDALSGSRVAVASANDWALRAGQISQWLLELMTGSDNHVSPGTAADPGHG